MKIAQKEETGGVFFLQIGKPKWRDGWELHLRTYGVDGDIATSSAIPGGLV